MTEEEKQEQETLSIEKMLKIAHDIESEPFETTQTNWEEP